MKTGMILTQKRLLIQSINVVVVGTNVFHALMVTSLWNYFYSQISRIIMHASNDVQQQVFVHCTFVVFIMYHNDLL